MSDALDYWPFDYIRYVEDILPALHLALEGQVRRLQHLIRVSKQRHLSFRSPWSLSRGTSASEPPSSDEFFAHLEDDLHCAFSTNDLTWETVERLVSFLPGHYFGELFEIGAELHLALVYALCSAPLPGGIEPWQPPVGGGEDESVWRWRDYFERNEPWRKVWEPFYQHPPAAITKHIPTPHEPAYPRGLNPFGEACGRLTLNGFLTPDETRRLARDLPLRRKPFLLLTSDEPVQDYVMRKWEQEISLSIPDYPERKRQYYRERNQLHWPAQWERESEEMAAVDKEEQHIRESLFGHELGSRLLYIPRGVSRMKDTERNVSEQEEEHFFLLPQEVYYGIDISASLPEWARAYPKEAEEIHRLDWEAVWQSEDELMRRLEYAVSRQWGMLMYYESGK